jgi:hypothetical protein
MRKLTLILAGVACLGLTAPAFATGVLSTGQSGPQLVRADSGKTFDLVAGKKKKGKKDTTQRKSWGG